MALPGERSRIVLDNLQHIIRPSAVRTRGAMASTGNHKLRLQDLQRPQRVPITEQTDFHVIAPGVLPA
jgi:hypothetical protein